jgi:hypothetical protein
MKVLKNISLVYTLQVLAVILLFSYAGSSSGKEAKVSLTDAVLPLVINKEKLFKAEKDSSTTGKINIIWKSIYTGKSR